MSSAEAVDSDPSGAWDVVRDASEFLNVVVVQVGALAAAVLAFVAIVDMGRRGYAAYRLWRWQRGENSGDRDEARREARRGYPRPRTQLARTYGAPLPERLTEALRCFGRVPIEPYRHRWRVVAFWRAARRVLFPLRTVPKAAFTVTDWRYRPLASTELARRHPYCGGFDLLIRLHPGENRWHLRRALQAGLRGRARRLLVIASARDMFEPESWVRCLVVDTDTLRLSKNAPGHAVLRGADPAAADGPVVFRRRQAEVPDDAVWLIVPTSAYRAPSLSWGESPEHHGQLTRVPVEPVPPDCGDVDNENYVRRRTTSYRKATVLLWALIGPGLLLFFGSLILFEIGMISLVARLNLDESGVGGFVMSIAERGTLAVAQALAVYAGFYVVAVVAALAELAAESVRAECWRRRESQGRRDWKGGTDECLLMGGLLRRGPSLAEWKEHSDGSGDH